MPDPSRAGFAARAPGEGLFTSTRPVLRGAQRRMAGTRCHPSALGPGPCPLPLGDRSPSKKHSRARPLRESPHGKSSVRGTWSSDRVSVVFLLFLCLFLLLWVSARFVLLPVRNGVLGWTRSAEKQRGDGVGGCKTGSAGRGHRREVGSPSRSAGKFKKSPAKC